MKHKSKRTLKFYGTYPKHKSIGISGSVVSFLTGDYKDDSEIVNVSAVSGEWRDKRYFRESRVNEYYIEFLTLNRKFSVGLSDDKKFIFINDKTFPWKETTHHGKSRSMLFNRRNVIRIIIRKILEPEMEKRKQA